MYQNLKKVLVADLKAENASHHRTLTVLFGYGPRFFELDGLGKAKPKYLQGQWLFLPPDVGGGPILPETGLRYAEDTTHNEVADDHLIVQFIGDTQLATHRAVVETWKFLKQKETDELSAPLNMRAFYTGFNRPDGRSWLGFHDGVSNVKASDRPKVILANRSTLDHVDYWTSEGGTYMAFLRIGIDLSSWEIFSINDQERIVGRQKSSGCPLVGTDRNGTNVFSPGCPARGTRQITEQGNERFRQNDTKYRRQLPSKMIASGPESSHVGRMLKVPVSIFRQGYEFLEPTQNYPYFRVGLNFVSFQSGSDKIYRSIKYGFGHVNSGSVSVNPSQRMENLLSVYAAGLFLVPPFHRGEAFPGEIIFKRTGSTPRYASRFPRFK
jgi:deferrochelatase/peroxidase EfeB